MKREKKKKRGAPSSFRPEYCQRVIEYFTRENRRKEIIREHVTYDKEGNIKSKSVEYAYFANDLPTWAGFAAELKTTQEVVRQWESVYPAFAWNCHRARELQHNMLVQNAMTRDYDGRFAAFIAMNYFPGEFQKQLPGQTANITFNVDSKPKELEEGTEPDKQDLIDMV